MLFSNFVAQYPLSKTLRFELKPIGKTLHHIKVKNFLEQDATLAESYQKIKPILDAFHRDFIERALKDVSLTDLGEYHRITNELKNNRNDDKLRKEMEKVQEKLRKAIVKQFKKDKATEEVFKSLFASDLFGSKKENGILMDWIIQKEGEDSYKIALIQSFVGFTTYFTGFYENRKNIYSDEAKHTAIAYRLIHENLPRFMDNLSVLKDIQSKHSSLYEQFKSIKPEILNNISIDELLKIDFYNQVLSQSGIDHYNSILGGKTLNNQQKLQGINELINLYNQKHKTKIAKLKPLYKQILSDKQSLSFLPQQFNDDYEICHNINEFYRCHKETFDKIEKLFKEMAAYDDKGVYIHHGQLNHLSHLLYGQFNLLSSALSYYYETHIDSSFTYKSEKAKSDKVKEKLYKEREKFIKNEHSIATLNQAVKLYAQNQDELKVLSLLDYFSSLSIQSEDKTVHLVKDIDNKHSSIKGFLEQERPTGEATFFKHKESDDIRRLKLLLDSILSFIHFIKPLIIESNTTLIKDERFYGELLPLYEELKPFSTLYNKVRDYVAQKAFQVQKYKLNFENPTLLNGWDLNKEKDNFGIILQKNGYYYLAILDKAHKKVFEQAPIVKGKDVYQKMVYKLLPGPNKMLPKVFFADSNIDYYAPPKELLEKYKQGTHKKGDNFNLQDCHHLIDFFKQSIDKHPEWKEFGFVFSDTKDYKDLSDFYREVEPQGYKVHFVDVDSQYIDDLVEQGKLYLFQIYNKDFSTKAYGNQNLHTLYFKALFSEDNLSHTVYKLNGEAEIFYRPASLKLDEVAIHRTGEELKMKNPNNKRVKTATHDIIKDKRYTEDKFLLHIPITMNFGASDTGFKAFNTKVNQTLKTSIDDIHIIGIDRGERHLLYVSVINQKGELIEQKSLNEIINIGHNGEKLITNYHDILNHKEIERQNARVNWGSIENIKEIKAGYLSQVVHYIVKLMIQYNAIVILEDLNGGFKRGRLKVEKQVYQKFENALIKKLNYLVFKDKKADKIGGVRQALQLTNNFGNIKDIGKQTGFLFYVPAWNTSKIDPTTGFVDLLKPKYTNIDDAKSFFRKFDGICYNQDKDYFEFYIDYQKFGNKASGSKTKWTICSFGDLRYAYNPNTKSSDKININECLKSLFEKHHIDYQNSKDLIDLICQSDKKDLYSSLIHYLKILLAMRYSNAQTGDDFILSPVMNNQGKFFDSRNANDRQPHDADANGAYHIALKGLWVLNQIKSSDDLDKLKLAISNQEWLEFTQNRK